jgi:hypothetical protein
MSGLELQALIAERDEAPTLFGVGDDGCELWTFEDGTEVIVTNAGLVTDDADGFAELRATIV